jgi:hypothetical protein
MTVATAVETKEDLELVESHHACPERVLSELLARRSGTETHAAPN